MRKIAPSIFLFGLFCFFSSELYAATYYFSTSGSNSAGSGSQASPFYSLCGPWNGAPCKTGTNKISLGQIKLNPGDTLLFRRGDEWVGLDAQWVVNAVGAPGSPITFGAYGDSALPRPLFTGAKTAFALGLDGGWQNVAGTPIWYISLAKKPWMAVQEETAPDGPALYGAWSVSGVTNANGWTADQSMVRGTHFYDSASARLYVWRTDNLKPDHSAGRDIYIGMDVWDGTDRMIKVNRGWSAGSSDPKFVGGHYIFKDLHVRMSNAYGFATSYPNTEFHNCISELNGMEGIIFDRTRFGAPLPGAKNGVVKNCIVRRNNLRQGQNIGQGITIESENVWIYDSEVYENAWAGIDFLDYNANTKTDGGGVVNSKVYNNGIHPVSSNCNDPNIYVDGGSNITIKNTQIWGAGIDPRGVKTRLRPNPGISIDLEGAAFYAGKRPTNIKVISTLSFGNAGEAIRIGWINGSQSAVKGLSNIQIIGNTLQRELKDTDLKAYYSPTNLNAEIRVFSYKGISSGLVFQNNIVLGMNTSRALLAGDKGLTDSGRSGADFDNNMYYCPTCSFDSTGTYYTGGFFSYWASGTMQNMTLDSWRNVGSTNAAMRRDVAFSKSFMTSNPQLLNTTASSFDARLASNSPALDKADTSVFPAGLTGTTRADGALDSPYNDLGFHYLSGSSTPAPADTAAPGVPSGLTATVSGTQVALSWNASSDNVGVTGYQVLRNGTVLGTVNALTFTDAGTSGSTYSYAVRAYDAAGNFSTASSAVSAVLSAPAADGLSPTAPSNLTAVLSGSTIQLSWLSAMDNVGVVDYQIFNGLALLGTVTGSFYSMTGLEGSTYAFTVKARDAAGNISLASNLVQVSVPVSAAPTAPANFTATYGSSKVRLQWSPVATAQSYTVYRNNSYLQMYTTTDVFDSAILPGTTYSYKVRANLPNNLRTDYSESISVIIPGGTDAEPPTTPAGLTGTITNMQVTLTWLASQDNVRVAGYRVYSSNSLLGETAYPVFEFAITTPGVPYILSVEAFDSANNASARTAAVTLTVPDVVPPTVPTGLAVSRQGDQLTLGWNPSTDDSLVAEYQVYDGSVLLGSVNGLSFTINPALLGHPYIFSVRAKDGQGNLSASSQLLNYTAPALPAVPENVVGFMIGNSAHLSWTNGAGAAPVSYEISRDNVVLSSGITNLFWDDTAPVASVTHQYRVRSVDAAGSASLWSLPAPVTVPGGDTTAPTAPANLTVKRTNNVISLSWGASSDLVGVTGYRVLSFSGATIGTTTSTKFDVGSIAPNTSYTFSVVAVDAAGNVSARSNSQSLTTPADILPPTAPTLSVTTSSTGAKLTWTASTDNVAVQGYNIYRNGIYLVSMTTRAFTDSNAAPNTSVTYKVKAFDVINNGTMSNEVTVRL